MSSSASTKRLRSPIYTDWDIDQLEETMRMVVGGDDDGDL
jgi:hypothetical protein